jgi:H+-transporting ATPase
MFTSLDAKAPVEWQLPKVWVVSSVMGLVLAGGTWITRATLFLKDGGIIQRFGSIQEILFLEVALTESWVIFMYVLPVTQVITPRLTLGNTLSTRMDTGKSSGGFVMPSWQLVGAVLGVDVLATFFCLFGWIGGPAPGPRSHKDTHSGWVDIVTVVRVWCMSLGVTVIVAFVCECNAFQMVDRCSSQKFDLRTPLYPSRFDFEQD